MEGFLLLVLAALLAGSTYGITIGRPIVQSSTWHFPYAETLQFPYPLTVTTFQMLIVSVFMLSITFLAFISKYALAAIHVRFSILPSDPRSSEAVWKINGHKTHTESPIGDIRARSDQALSPRVLLLAITVATDAVLGAYATYFAPLEIFLLSRALVLPLSLVFMRYRVLDSSITSKKTYTSIMLSIGVVLAAYRPNLPLPTKIICFAIAPSIMSATWAFQFEHVTQSHQFQSQNEYQPLKANLVNIFNGQKLWRLLRHTSLLAVLVLIPILIYSDELGKIDRNCYFLGVSDFWYFLFSGGVFRSILFTSSIVLIKLTSAFSFVLLLILVDVSQVIFLTYSKLLYSQWLGLIICSFAALWFFTSTDSSLSSQDLNQKSVASRQVNKSSRRWPLYVMICALAGLIMILITQTKFPSRSSQRNEESSPTTQSDDDHNVVLLRGTDAYLNSRPHVNAIVNLTMLVQECRGTYEELENMHNIYRCLDFLSNEESMYLITSKDPNSDQKSRSIDSAAFGKHGQFSKVTTANQSGIAIKECEGPIIPYHIWWTGSPIWRIELFIKSYFHTQNLACSKLYIWVNSDHHQGAMEKWSSDPHFQRFMPFVNNEDIVLKEWKLPARVPLPSIHDELDDTRYYQLPRITNRPGELLVADSVILDADGQEWLQLYEDEAQLTYFTVAVSDAARLIILHLHGGVYLDPDMLLLRDLRPLLLPGKGFAERWGASSDPAAYNNGLVYLPANSSLSSYILRAGTRMGLMYHFQAIGRMLHLEGRDDSDDRGLIKLEGTFFDPMWIENDHQREGRCTVPCLPAFEYIFQSAPIHNEWESFDGEPLPGSASGNNRTLENFYRGAYAHHIHNLWDLEYEPGSWIDVICRAHDGFFDRSRTNAYGEYWTGLTIIPYDR